ncbi:Protein of unknown function [Gryllus bimaculatus]|nr:Protein of unknown function [Gryllus bimaculatus]
MKMFDFLCKMKTVIIYFSIVIVFNRKFAIAIYAHKFFLTKINIKQVFFAYFFFHPEFCLKYSKFRICGVLLYLVLNMPRKTKLTFHENVLKCHTFYHCTSIQFQFTYPTTAGRHPHMINRIFYKQVPSFLKIICYFLRTVLHVRHTTASFKSREVEYCTKKSLPVHWNMTTGRI